jgi:cytochrome c553
MRHSLISLILLLLSPVALAVDLDNGQDINDTCAGCHGEFGQGGGDSEYPRLAGMPAAFIAKQLHLFRDRIRPNMAMVEYVDERQMPDADIQDVSHYLASITLKTKLPPVDESAPDFDAYARLKASKQLMQIPRAEGDVVQGETLYRKECGSCHGREGWGDNDKAVPQLAGQFTDYLWRQVAKYRNKIRIHDESDPDDELLNDFSDEQLKHIFAYLSIVDD